MSDGIIELIHTVMNDKLNHLNFTSSLVGTVQEIDGRTAYVAVRDLGIISAIIPQSFWGMIDENDIVVVFDLHNNGVNKYIQGVISDKGEDRNIHIRVWDSVNNVIISQIFRIFNTETNETVSTILRIYSKGDE